MYETESCLPVCRLYRTSATLTTTADHLLLAADKSEKGVDDAEVLGILHSLYSMTFTTQGRQSVAFVFGFDDNLRVLLPFIEVTGMKFDSAGTIRFVFFQNFFWYKCTIG